METTSHPDTPSSFNSLQTGKYIQSPNREPSSWKISSFNSLQTGKYIQRLMTCAMRSSWCVSIPFKRESISKALAASGVKVFNFRFQFPSNGKVYPKNPNPRLQTIHNPQFQFPSNGKVYPKSKSLAKRRINSICVSIPFKRESISKDIEHRDNPMLSI